MPTEPLRCAGAPIVDDDGRISVRRRSPERPVFPSAWDGVGGRARRTAEGASAALRPIGL